MLELPAQAFKHSRVASGWVGAKPEAGGPWVRTSVQPRSASTAAASQELAACAGEEDAEDTADAGDGAAIVAVAAGAEGAAAAAAAAAAGGAAAVALRIWVADGTLDWAVQLRMVDSASGAERLRVPAGATRNRRAQRTRPNPSETGQRAEGAWDREGGPTWDGRQEEEGTGAVAAAAGGAAAGAAEVAAAGAAWGAVKQLAGDTAAMGWPAETHRQARTARWKESAEGRQSAPVTSRAWSGMERCASAPEVAWLQPAHLALATEGRRSIAPRHSAS